MVSQVSPYRTPAVIGKEQRINKSKYRVMVCSPTVTGMWNPEYTLLSEYNWFVLAWLASWRYMFGNEYGEAIIQTRRR